MNAQPDNQTPSPAEFTVACADTARQLQAYIKTLNTMADAPGLNQKMLNKLIALEESSDECLARIRRDTLEIVAHLHEMKAHNIIIGTNTDEHQ